MAVADTITDRSYRSCYRSYRVSCREPSTLYLGRRRKSSPTFISEKLQAYQTRHLALQSWAHIDNKRKHHTRVPFTKEKKKERAAMEDKWNIYNTCGLVIASRLRSYKHDNTRPSFLIFPG